jgi:hypothetical protein
MLFWCIYASFAPWSFESFFVDIRANKSLSLLGQSYILDQQCKLIFGNFSYYCNGVRIILQLTFFNTEYFKSYKKNGITNNNDAVMCQTIYCFNPKPEFRYNGTCTGGTGTQGIEYLLILRMKILTNFISQVLGH